MPSPLGKFVTLFACRAIVTIASSFPTPPETTAAQKQVLATQKARAKEASDAATDKVIAFFDSSDFRSELTSCCPQAAKLSSQELLERLRAEMQAAELAHSFPAGSSSSGPDSDVIIDTIKQSDFWLNEWQVPIMKGGHAPTQFNPAEEGLFGCAPFLNDAKPTWEEASDRLIYIVQNTRQVDYGSRPTFGQISAIFKKSYVKDNVLIAAVDTGLWERSCNASRPRSKVNCDAWSPHQVGTLDHLDHLILANFGSWATSRETSAQIAGRFFARTPLAGNYLDLAT